MIYRLERIDRMSIRLLKKAGVFTTIFVLVMAMVFGDFGFLPVPKAFATTCANDGSVTNFFDDGSGHCVGYIISTGSGSFTLPSDWTSTNIIEVIGGGGGGESGAGSGGSANQGGGGGGGGGYSKVTNITVSNGASYSVGFGGGSNVSGASTWFGGAACNTSSVCATGGQAGTFPNGGAPGGGGPISVASTTARGGTGGNGQAVKNTNGGGGGGAAGCGAGTCAAGSPGADGNNGQPSTGTSAGGQGDGVFGGGGGPAATNGTPGNEWGTSLGSGGGGGGATSNSTAGNNGGNYGSGGGGGRSLSGSGGQGGSGLIVITYTPTATAPTVSTNAATSIAANSATLNGNITDTGGATVTARGFATSTNATLSSGVSTSTESGTFSSGAYSTSSTGLAGNTTYYVRAFATNSVGTSYGSIQSFLTLPNAPGTPTYSSTLATSTGVTWSAPSGGASTYKLEQCITGSSTCSLFAGISGNSTTTYSLSSNTSYDYAVRATNATGDSTWSATSTVVTNVGTTTLANATDPSNLTLAPGDVGTSSDAFTLQTNTGTSSVSAVVVDLGSGAAIGISRVDIVDSTASTTYGSIADPTSDTPTVTLNAAPLVANTTLTTYKIRITPKSHANMPAVPGGTYSVTAKISAFTAQGPTTGSDTAGTTLTIDNASPNNVSGASVTPGALQNSLSWTNPGADYAETVVLRATSTIDTAPVDGTNYASVGTLTGLGITGVGTPSLARLSSTTVAFADNSNNSLREYSWDGTSWSLVGSGKALPSFGFGSGAALAALNATDVAFVDSTNDKLTAYRFNGSTWSQIGASTTLPNIGKPSLTALNSTDVAFISDGSPFKLATYRFNGSSWSEVGASTTVSSLTDPVVASLSSSTVALIAFSGSGAVTNLRTYGFNGTSWSQVGNGLSLQGFIDTPSITALSSTTVAVGDWNGGNGSLYVYRFNGTDWVQIGNTFSISNVNNTGVAVAALNGADVAYIDDTNDSLTAYRWDGTNWTQNKNVVGNATVAYVGAGTSFTDTGLTAGTSYNYKIFTHDAYGNYATGTIPTGSPATPTAAAPTVTTSAASSVAATSTALSGTIADTGGATVTVRGFASSTSSTLSSGVSTSTESGSFGTGTFTGSMGGLTGNTTYYFRAYATNPSGTGYGAIQSTTTLPGIPGTPTFASITQTSLTVNWAGPVGSSTSYKVERCSGNGCSNFSQIASGVGTTTYDDSGLTQGTTYNYRVRGSNATGDGLYSASAQATTNSNTITISGTLYGASGPISGKTVKVSVNGAAAISSSATDSNGGWSASVGMPNANDPIAAWVTGDATTRAFTLIKAATTTSITAVQLYKNSILLSNAGVASTPITNTDLSLADSGMDASIQFKVTNGALVTAAGQRLEVASSTMYSPGGRVTTSGNAQASPDGDFALDSQAMFYGGGPVSIAGSLLASTTAYWISNGSEITFTASSSGKAIFLPAFATMEGMGSTTFSGSGSWTFGSAATTSELLVANGTVNMPATTIGINGSYANNAAASFASTGTTTLAAKTAVTGIDAGGTITSQIGSSAFNATFATTTNGVPYLYAVKAGDSTDCGSVNKIGCEFQIYNISDPTNPVYVGGADGDGSTNSGVAAIGISAVYVSGNYAYVGEVGNSNACSSAAGSLNGCELKVFDISNPSAPRYVGGADVGGTINSGTASFVGFTSAFVSGNYLYMTEAGAVGGACASTAGSTNTCELKVFDISTPSAITYVGGADSSGVANAGGGSDAFNSVFVQGNFAYVAKASDAADCTGSSSRLGCELQIYDVSTPSAPAFVGGADADGTTNGGTASGQSFSSVFVSGNYAYIAASASSTACSITAGNGNGCELRVFDISTPATPTYVGGADAGGQTNAGTRSSSFLSVYVSGNYAYIGDTGSTLTCTRTAGSSNGCELKVFDISTPSTPTYLGGADAGGTTNSNPLASPTGTFNNVFVQNNYAYVSKTADANECNNSLTISNGKSGCELQVYDVSSSTKPSFAAGVDAAVNGTAVVSSAINAVFATTTNGTLYLYVVKAGDSTDCGLANNHEGCELQIYNLSNPASPVYVGGADSNGATNTGTTSLTFLKVYVTGGYAYVASSASGAACRSTVALGVTNGCELKIFDVSNPASPTYVAGADADGEINAGTDIISANGIFVSGGYAYLALNSYATGGACSATGGSANGCEFKVFNVSNPAAPTYTGGADAGGLTNSGSSLNSFNDVYVSGNYAYLAETASSTACSATASGGNGCELKIFNIGSTPGTPTYVGGADASGATNASTTSSSFNSVFVSGNYVYVAKSNSTADCGIANDKNGCELQVYDIGTGVNGASSSVPVFVGGASEAGGTNSGAANITMNSVNVSGAYAFITTASFAQDCSTVGNKSGCEVQAYDISTPSAPAFVGGADRGGTINSGLQVGSVASVYAANGYVYTAAGGSATDCAGATKIGCELQVFRQSDLTSLSTPGASGTLTGGGALNNLVVTGPRKFNANAAISSYQANSNASTTAPSALTVAGNFSNSGTFNANSGTVTFTGISPTIGGTLTGASAFNNLTINSSATTTLFGAASTTNLTITSGAVAAPMSVSVSGTYTGGGNGMKGTLTLLGTSATLTGSMTANAAIDNVIVATGTATFSSNASTTNLTVNSGATVSAPALLSIAGNYFNTGTFSANSGTVFVGSSTAPVLNFAAGVDVTVNGGAVVSSAMNATFIATINSTPYLFVAKAGDSADCSLSNNHEGCELQIYDISSSTNPIYVGGANSDGRTNAGTGSVAFNSVAVSGNYAYVTAASDLGTCSATGGAASGCELKVFDVSNPASPTYVGGADANGTTNSGSTGNSMTSVFISGNYAYVTLAGSGGFDCSSTIASCELQIYDISSPSTPTLVGRADSGGSTATGLGSATFNSVYVSGSYAYAVASGLSGTCSNTAGTTNGCELKVFDISTPSNPTYVGGADADGTTNGGASSGQAFNSVFVSGNVAYIAAAASSTACTATAGSGNGCELKVFDISTPSTPTYVGGADSGGTTNSGGSVQAAFTDVTVSGNYAYVTLAQTTGTCSITAGITNGCNLKVFDISTPSAPTFLGGSVYTGSTNAGTGNGGFASVTLSGSSVFVTTNAPGTTDCRAVTKDGCELQIYDVTTPSTPTFVGGSDSSGTTTAAAGLSAINGTFVSGNYLYVAKAGNSTDCSSVNKIGCELQIYDISNPSSPTFVGGADADGTTNGGTSSGQSFNAVFVIGTHAFVAASASSTVCAQTPGAGNGCELKVFDISNPASPTYIGGADASGNTNGFSHARDFNDVFVSGNYAYVTMNANASSCGTVDGCELQIYDISDPTQPTIVGGADASGGNNAGTGNQSFQRVFVSGNYAYVTSNGGATDCATVGNKVGCELQIFDVSDPSSPNLVAALDASGSSSGTSNDALRNAVVSGNYLYVTQFSGDVTDCASATSKAGCEFKIYDISTPSSPVYVGGADGSGTTNSGTAGAGYFSLAVSGNYAYLTHSNNATECATIAQKSGCELQVFDISNPSSPLLVTAADASGVVGSGAVARANNTVSVAGNYAYVGGAGDVLDCNSTGNKEGCELQIYSTSKNALSGTLTGSSAFNNLTLTNTSGRGGADVSVLFLSVASTTGTFTMSASTSAQFLASATSSFQNFTLQGAGGQKVWLRSSASGTPWGIKVLGSATVQYADVKDSSACSGVTITASNSTDSGNNSCWNFGGIAVIVSGGGPGGGAEIGSAPPGGQGTVSGGGEGGSSGTAQEIGNEPGFFAPSSNSSVSGWAAGWTNPGNAYASDNTYATSNATSATDFYTFGFNIPSTDTITGISVKIEASASVGGGSIPVELSWNSGSATTTAGIATGAVSTVDTVYTLGGASTLWGRSWTPSEFSNANFRIRVMALPSSNTLKIDAIQVNVYHQATGGGGGGGGEI